MVGTITSEHVDKEIKISFLMLEELAEFSQEWDEIPDWKQDDWTLEWGQFLNKLKYVLHKAYQSGQMTPEQKNQYKELWSKLKEAAPTLKKLDPSPPPVSLAEVA